MAALQIKRQKAIEAQPPTLLIKQKGKIRKMKADDVEVISDMSMEMFPRSKEMTREQQMKMIRRLYLENPLNCDGNVSLVYESPGGEVGGFLGVIKKKWIWRGRPIKVSHSNHLMIRDTERSTLASVALVKTMMQDDHDFCFADSSSDTSRFIWERCGGVTAWGYSMYYRHLLQPLSFICNRLPRNYGRLLNPVSKAGDFLINHIPGSPLKFDKPSCKIEELSVTELLQLMEEVHRNLAVRPVYSTETLVWLIESLKIEKRYGPFKAIKVINDRGFTAGWVLYHQKENGACEVLQLEARRGMKELVFKALCYHAFQGGGVELDGRLDPRLLKKFGDRTTIFVPGKFWTLVYSKNPDLMADLQAGNAVLTRLEGDLWLI